MKTVSLPEFIIRILITGILGVLLYMGISKYLTWINPNIPYWIALIPSTAGIFALHNIIEGIKETYQKRKQKR